MTIRDPDGELRKLWVAQHGRLAISMEVEGRQTWTKSRGDGSPSDREAFTLVAGNPLGMMLTVDGRRGLDIEREEMETAGTHKQSGQ